MHFTAKIGANGLPTLENPHFKERLEGRGRHAGGMHSHDVGEYQGPDGKAVKAMDEPLISPVRVIRYCGTREHQRRNDVASAARRGAASPMRGSVASSSIVARATSRLACAFQCQS